LYDVYLKKREEVMETLQDIKNLNSYINRISIIENNDVLDHKF